MNNSISRRDIEALSAYLDNQLSARQKARLENRLAAETDLQAALEGLRQTRSVLRQAPQARAPRNFTLTPKMAGQTQGPRWYPRMRFVSALASILFVLVFAGDLFSANVASQALRAVPGQADAPAAAPAMESAVEEQVVEELESAAPQDFNDKSGDVPLPTPAPMGTSVPPAEPAAAAMEAADGALGLQEGVGGGGPIEEEAPAEDNADASRASDEPQDDGYAALPLAPTGEPAGEARAGDVPQPEMEVDSDAVEEELTQADAVSPIVEPEPEPEPAQLPWLRILEALLALLALISGGIAIRMRRKN